MIVFSISSQIELPQTLVSLSKTGMLRETKAYLFLDLEKCVILQHLAAYERG